MKLLIGFVDLLRRLRRRDKLKKHIANFAEILFNLSSLLSKNKCITKSGARLDSAFVYGAANRIRTDDLVITNDVLYRLSYSSIAISQRRYYNKKSPRCQVLFRKYFTFFVFCEFFVFFYENDEKYTPPLG